MDQGSGHLPESLSTREAFDALHHVESEPGLARLGLCEGVDTNCKSGHAFKYRRINAKDLPVMYALAWVVFLAIPVVPLRMLNRQRSKIERVIGGVALLVWCLWALMVAMELVRYALKSR